MKKQIEKIAKEILSLDTLKEQGMDDLDFHDISVVSLKKALEAAFKAGEKKC